MLLGYLLFWVCRFVLLLFCDILLIEASLPLTNSWTWNSNADSSQLGFRFYGHVYRTRTGYDVHQCALYCEQDTRCKSYNYLSNEMLCELCETERHSVEVPVYVQVGHNWLPTENELIQFAGSQYLSRDVITLKSKKILPSCASSPCPEDHVCSSSIVGGYSCQKMHFVKTDLTPQWNSWGSWSECSKTCGGGIETRTRTCQSSEVKRSCIGKMSESQLCQSQHFCPQWSSWGTWSRCDKIELCGEGFQKRSRQCLHGVLPDNGSCSGNHEQVIKCRLPSCSTPTRLSNGLYGNAWVYDDSALFNPVWRPVCKSSSDEYYQFYVRDAICRSYDMYASDDTIHSVGGALPQVFLAPIACGVGSRSLFGCVHDGIKTSDNCDGLLSLRCADAAEIHEVFRCRGEDDLVITCPYGKNIEIRNGFYGRENTNECGYSTVTDCFSAGALKEYKNECEGRQTCTLQPRNVIYGNPCPGADGVIKLNYSCFYDVSSFYAGMKDGSIIDSDISASSSYSGSLYLPMYARLDGKSSWVAKHRKNGEWIQVVFKNATTVILGVITQGRPATSQHVTGFNIAYGTEPSSLTIIKNKQGEPLTFKGNQDANTHVINYFDRPVMGRYLRLTVVSFNGHPSLRLEYLIVK